MKGCRPKLNTFVASGATFVLTFPAGPFGPTSAAEQEAVEERIEQREERLEERRELREERREER